MLNIITYMFRSSNKPNKVTPILLKKSNDPLIICNTSGSGCILCKYIVISPRCKCRHNFCDYCLITRITYNNNQCIFCCI